MYLLWRHSVFLHQKSWLP